MQEPARSSTRLTEEELFRRWQRRWSRFVDDFSPSVSSEIIPELLRDKIKNGNAERAIAGGHEGREILELLQNARDAIPPGVDSGRVYVGVYEEGVLVANTGTPFDLFDEDVEDAVTMIGESAKDESDEEIGHKGVGLKSILSTGEAFEIWSRHEAATDNILRVRLSRANITAALLRSLGYEADAITDQLEVPSDPIQELDIDTSASTQDVQLESDAREAIGKLPLFDFPIPLSPTIVEERTVEERAANLITGGTDEWYGDQFRTAVFIDYEDDAWRDLLSAFDIPHPNPPERSAKERADQLWSYLSSRSEERGLTAETLVQFGGIDTLLLERIDEDGTRSREEWEVNRSKEAIDADQITFEQVEVSITREGKSVSTDAFDEFRFENQESDVQLLVPRDIDPGTSVPAYPLYLYYPIENTRDVSLPYSLHGHFVVETNRKDLSLNSLAENKATLKRGITLIGAVAEATAQQQLGSQYPWILLPPAPEDPPTEPNTQANILTWLQAQIFAELRDRDCIPTVEDNEGQPVPVSPGQALIHWNSTIRDGFQALYNIDVASNPTVHSNESAFEFPTQATLSGCNQFPSLWNERIKRLLDVTEPESFSVSVAETWASILSATVSQDQSPDSTPHLICNAETARDLFSGTVETILQTGSQDETIRSTLSNLTADLESVYLLPCRHTNSEDNPEGESSNGGVSNGKETSETLLLTPIESQEGSPSGQRQKRRSRSVIWDVDSPEQGSETPDVPNESSSYRVYFFDRQTEQDERARRLMELAGRPWGIRRYDGTPSYFRELLDTFSTPDSARITALDFHFLASQINKLGSESRDLQTREGAFIPLDYLESAVSTTEGDQRQNLRRRINLRNSEVKLSQGGGRYRFDTTFLGNDWQKLRAFANDDEGVDDWEGLTAQPESVWPAPDSEAWAPIARAIGTDDRYHRIAETLSLIGASVFPGIQCVWMYGTAHPRPRGSASWNPLNWTGETYSEGVTVPDTAQKLQTAIEQHPNYINWLTAPGRHPQDTAEHSSKCNVKTDGILQSVYLASWTWFNDLDIIEGFGEADLIELLSRYDRDLRESILQTGWTCSHGHQRDGYGWQSTVPTLLNWQLRTLPLWESIVSVNSQLAKKWEDDIQRLSYTVRKTGSRGARPARLFPHIESDQTGLSTDLLDVLGVKPISAFDATEASWHLQQLVEVLAVHPLGSVTTESDDRETPAQEPVPLDIPEDRLNDWNAAYTDLLTPILHHLPEDDATVADLDISFLTHLPIKYEGQWAAASLDWIKSHAADGRYYEDQSPKPWERQQVEQGDYWLLPQTSAGPYSRLTEALGISRVDASKPVFEADDLLFQERSVSGLRSHLQDRQALLIASLEQTSEERIREFSAEFNRAISDLRVAERFPEGPITESLIDSSSGLYYPRENEEAFVLNGATFDEEPSLDGLAMAVGLLAEQPTKVPVFREVLSPDFTTTELEKRWRQSFPLTTVERILGTQRRQRLRRQLIALTDLIDRLGHEVTDSADDVVEEIDSDDDDSFRTFTESLQTANLENLDAANASRQTRFVNEIHNALSPPLTEILPRIFGGRSTTWSTVVAEVTDNEDLEETVIGWLATNSTAVDAASCFPESVRAMHDRLLDVVDVWTRTDTDDLTEIETWQSRLVDLSIDRSIEWTTPLHSQLRTEDMDKVRLFYYTPAQQYQSRVVTPFLNEIEGELGTQGEEVHSGLRQYVTSGEFPATSNSRSAADHQDGALTDLRDPERDFTSSALIDAEFDIGTASARQTGSRGGGGGSTEFRGRGQQAEAATLVAILNDTAEWLRDEPVGRIRDLRSAFRRLHQREQDQNHGYMWHLDRVWEDQLLPLLDADILTRESIVEWRTQIDDGQRLRDHPLVTLCNVALEHGPGYDVIDPFGSLQEERTTIDQSQFAPVEIKAVGGTTPPFDFRLTTNEYKRAKAFTRADDREYIIRLVYVPEPEHPNWVEKTRFVSELVLDQPTAVDRLVRDAPFEEIVKGGYMNMRLTEN